METSWVKRSKIFSKFWFFLIFIFLVIVVPIAGLTFWVKWAIAAPAKIGKEQVFVITEKESTQSIANRLKQQGLIKDSLAFRIYARLDCKGINFAKPLTLLKKYSNAECLSGKIQAGSFKLSPTMDLATLSTTLTKGRVDSWIRILEGLRNEEVVEKLVKQYSFKKEDFLQIAKLGYMFPDTYLFKVNSTAKEISDKMQTTFSEKFDASLIEKVKAQGLTAEEGVTLASIVQRESGKSEDDKIIASVFYNRINIGMPLGADATTQYALGYDTETKTWWKKDLTEQDLGDTSPYNTRKASGLPPGPICNPGLAALKAVAEPATSDYYYFLYGTDGKLHLAKTLAEHNANKIKYLQ